MHHRPRVVLPHPNVKVTHDERQSVLGIERVRGKENLYNNNIMYFVLHTEMYQLEHYEIILLIN